MKVVQTLAGAQHGGAETFFMDVVRGLHREGLDQLVIIRPDEKRIKSLESDGIAYKTLPFGGLLDFKTKPQLHKIIQDYQPDIVQSFMGRASSYHTPGPWKHIGWFGGYYDVKRFKNCDAYVGVTYDITRNTKEQLRARGEDENKARTIHTFADLDNNSQPLKRSDFDTPEDAKVFCALARLHWKKGLDTLLNSFAYVPDAYLWIAGDGEDEQKLKKQMNDLGLQDRVRFLGWQDDRASVLKASDYCVFPSRYEPFGTVMVEAWAMDTPIICAASQGPREYLKDEQNGLLVPVDDEEALTTAMKRFLTDEDLCQAVVDGGRKTYEKTFTENAVVQEYMNLYHSVLDEGSLPQTKTA